LENGIGSSGAGASLDDRFRPVLSRKMQGGLALLILSFQINVDSLAIASRNQQILHHILFEI